MEVGSGKQEHGVIAEIFGSFGINFDELAASYSARRRGRVADFRNRAAELLAEAAPSPESLLNEVVRFGGRFIAMLIEVYRRLARHAAAEMGTSTTFRLDRAGVNEAQLPISEAFIERVRQLERLLRTVEIGRIDETAISSFVGWDDSSYGTWPLRSGNLRLANAVLNLAPISSALSAVGRQDSSVIHGAANSLTDDLDAVRASADRLAATAEKVVRAYVTHADLLAGIDAETAVEHLFPADNSGDLMASSKRSAVSELELFRTDRMLGMAVAPEYVAGIDVMSAIGLNARLEPVVSPADSYRDHTGVGALAFFVAMYHKGFWPARLRPGIAEQPGNLAESRAWLTEVKIACDEAAEWLAGDVITVTGSAQTTDLLESIREFLNLPFWRQRSLLYEVWVLCATLDACEQASWTTELRGLTQTNGTWVLTTGPASDPVAALRHVSDHTITLDVWREPSRATSAAQYTPDVAVSTPAPFTRDLLIVEAKDRSKMQVQRDRSRRRTDRIAEDKTAEHRTALGVARRYATALAPNATWVCNHCDFRQATDPATNYGNAWSRVHLADQFRPGNVPDIFAESVQAALSPPGLRSEHQQRISHSRTHDRSGLLLIIDATGSMSSKLDGAYAMLRESGSIASFNEFRAVLYSDHGAGEPFLVRNTGPFSDLPGLLDNVRAFPTGYGGDADEALEDAMQRCREMTDDLGPQSVIVLTDARPHAAEDCPYRISFESEVQAMLDSGSRIYVASDWLSYSDETWLEFNDAPGFQEAPLSEILDTLAPAGPAYAASWSAPPSSPTTSNSPAASSSSRSEASDHEEGRGRQ